jgi:hypothetical protein
MARKLFAEDLARYNKHTDELRQLGEEQQRLEWAAGWEIGEAMRGIWDQTWSWPAARGGIPESGLLPQIIPMMRLFECRRVYASVADPELRQKLFQGIYDIQCRWRGQAEFLVKLKEGVLSHTNFYAGRYRHQTKYIYALAPILIGWWFYAVIGAIVGAVVGVLEALAYLEGAAAKRRLALREARAELARAIEENEWRCGVRFVFSPSEAATGTLPADTSGDKSDMTKILASIHEILAPPKEPC